jgi:hypothetical protein
MVTTTNLYNVILPCLGELNYLNTLGTFNVEITNMPISQNILKTAKMWLKGIGEQEQVFKDNILSLLLVDLTLLNLVEYFQTPRLVRSLTNVVPAWSETFSKNLDYSTFSQIIFLEKIVKNNNTSIYTDGLEAVLASPTATASIVDAKLLEMNFSSNIENDFINIFQKFNLQNFENMLPPNTRDGLTKYIMLLNSWNYFLKAAYVFSKSKQTVEQVARELVGKTRTIGVFKFDNLKFSNVDLASTDDVEILTKTIDHITFCQNSSLYKLIASKEQREIIKQRIRESKFNQTEELVAFKQLLENNKNLKSLLKLVQYATSINKMDYLLYFIWRCIKNSVEDLSIEQLNEKKHAAHRQLYLNVHYFANLETYNYLLPYGAIIASSMLKSNNYLMNNNTLTVNVEPVIDISSLNYEVQDEENMNIEEKYNYDLISKYATEQIFAKYSVDSAKQLENIAQNIIKTSPIDGRVLERFYEQRFGNFKELMDYYEQYRNDPSDSLQLIYAIHILRLFKNSEMNLEKMQKYYREKTLNKDIAILIISLIANELDLEMLSIEHILHDKEDKVELFLNKFNDAWEQMMNKL